MSPDGLAALRAFFATTEAHLPGVVSLMYVRFFEARPDAALLFNGDMRNQQRQFTSMLWSIVRLTRSSELWPVNALTGQARLPVIEDLGASHACAGVRPEDFEAMKTVLAQCFREQFPKEFTPPVENALGFIFDVASRSTAAQTGARQAGNAQRKRPEAAKNAAARHTLKEALAKA